MEGGVRPIRGGVWLWVQCGCGSSTVQQKVSPTPTYCPTLSAHQNFNFTSTQKTLLRRYCTYLMRHYSIQRQFDKSSTHDIHSLKPWMEKLDSPGPSIHPSIKPASQAGRRFPFFLSLLILRISCFYFAVFLFVFFPFFFQFVVC